MAKRQKFEVGDLAVLLDGSDNDPNGVGWVSDTMDDLVGTVVTIISCMNTSRGATYKIDECPFNYTYDELWLSPLEKPETVNIDELEQFFTEVPV